MPAASDPLCLPMPLLVPRRLRPSAPLRVDGRWNGEDVGRHLLDRQRPIVGGLRHESPWSGLDDDTLDGLLR